MIEKLKSVLAQIDSIHRNKAIKDLEWEVQELKHIFSLITAGSLTGIPTVPLPVTLTLLPDMRQEVATMLSKTTLAYDPLADLFSKLDTF